MSKYSSLSQSLSLQTKHIHTVLIRTTIIMQKQNSENFSAIKIKEGGGRNGKENCRHWEESRSCIKDNNVFSYPIYLDLNIGSCYFLCWMFHPHSKYCYKIIPFFCCWRNQFTFQFLLRSLLSQSSDRYNLSEYFEHAKGEELTVKAREAHNTTPTFLVPSRTHTRHMHF